MGLIPTGGKNKNSLDEIKRMTLGKRQPQENASNKDYSNTPKNPFPSTDSNSSSLASMKKEVQADIDEFKSEQKIFTQVTSIKELIEEQDYSVPKELDASPKELDANNKELSTTKPKNNSFMLSAFKNEQNLNQKDTGEDGKSAFEKLMHLANTNLFEDKKTGTIKNESAQRQEVQQKKEPIINSDGNSVQEKEQPPAKILAQKETIKNEPAKNMQYKEYDWMKRPTIEEPEEKDFGKDEKESQKMEETKTTSQNATETKTPIDELFDLLEKFGKIDTASAGELIKLSPETVELIAKKFEEDGVLEIEYPASLTKKPVLKIKTPVISKTITPPKGKILQSYEIIVDYVPAKIDIILTPGEARPIYSIQTPSIGKYTKHFLEFIKSEVAESMPIDIEEIVDIKKSKKLKDRFFYELTSHLVKYFPTAQVSLLNMLSGDLLHDMYGLGEIELLMGDDMLEEVGINSSKTALTVYHKVHGWLKTNLMPGTEDEINNLSSQIGRKVGREITNLNPILDAHLISGDRVNATLFPISSEGNTITIRRFARKPWTIIDLIGQAHTMNSEMAALLWLAMQYELNVVIAGGTASGKTSTLNSLLALMPTYHRLISIEDVREIVLPKFLEWNWVPMVTRSPNPEGLGEVSMLDLMITSLRMRPDRIIVGEMRRKKEAEVLMEAIETGHSIYSTIHANSAYQVLRRLAEPPMSIPLMQIELIDLIVVQYRDRKTNKRRTFEISEVEQTSTGQGLQINTVYKWNPRSDSWDKLNKPNKLTTLLNLHTGLTEEDIDREIGERQKILEWMRRQNIVELNQIGYIIKLYYSSPEKILEMAKKNIALEDVIKIMLEEGETQLPEENKKNWAFE
ncbi:MAG: ATPase, T2SS/T4P/T4SS family [Candidatus Diapherotrites archaeon]|nr:ATPase, T2SS/T4P/T4SS family [Candidatus Diapherotrites archaeon]